MAICPSCGFVERVAGARFCGVCGAIIPADGTLGPTHPSSGETFVETVQLQLVEHASIAEAASGSIWIASEAFLTKIDTRAGGITSIPLPGIAFGLAATETEIWVASARDNTLLGIDPVTCETTRAIELDFEPIDLVRVGDRLAVNHPEGVALFDLTDGAQLEWIVETQEPFARLVAAGATGFFAVDTSGTFALQLDRDGRALGTWIGLGEDAFDLTFAGGSLWVGYCGSGEIREFDPQAGGALVGEWEDESPTPSEWISVDANARGVWFVDDGGTLTCIDLASRTVAGEWDLERRIDFLVCSGEQVWGVDESDGRLARLDRSLPW